jgi:hypothetical protein
LNGGSKAQKPPKPAPVRAPPQAEATPDDEQATAAAMRRKGLRKTLLGQMAQQNQQTLGGQTALGMLGQVNPPQ